jgi:MFS transporter, DHA1 family, inner membrane transport protein
MHAATSDYSVKSRHSRFLLTALGLSIMSTWLVTVAFQLLLVDIANSFNVSVGTAGLTAAVGSISGIIFGLLMAVLSVRFNHKLFLIIGLGFTCLAALGFFLASNFALLLVPNIGVGGGIAMVTSMAYSIVGDLYPLQKRGRAIGILVASTTLAYVIGAPTIGLIAQTFGGWRSVMVLLSLPVTLISLSLALFAVPSKPNAHLIEEKEPFAVGCKLAFSNRSTFAALAVTMFMLCEGAIGFYTVSFFRQQFSMSIDGGAVFTLTGSILGAVGGAVSGLLVNSVGRKRLGTITCVITGILTLSFTFMPTLGLSWGLSIARYWFSAMTMTAGGSLIIEQLPKYRSTMMSLNTAFMNVGMLLASITAGVMLNLYNYQSVGLALGSFGLLGAVVWITLVKEPCK